MKYESKIELQGQQLRISVAYEAPATREDVELFLDYYQLKFSQRAGRPVPREEIRVEPKEGEIREENTFFSVTQGEPLYIGLHGVHQRAPYVLPNLIQDLRRYREEQELEKEEDELIQYTIEGLREIIE